MPRISHKKASALSCVNLHAEPVTRLAEQVAVDIEHEIDSINGQRFSSCSVSDAVARLLPTVTCALQPNELLLRCAALHVLVIPPPRLAPSCDDGGEVPCVSSCAAAYTIMWSLLLEGVGDVVQRGVLGIMARCSHKRALHSAGCRVLLAAHLPEAQDGDDDHLAFVGLPASIDLLLADEIGGKVVNDNRGHVIKLLSLCAKRVLYCRGVDDAVNAEISPAGNLAYVNVYLGIVNSVISS